MLEALQVLGIATLGAIITALGAPIAEMRTVRNSVVSGALQLAAGILTGIVLVDLLPAPLSGLPLANVAIAFCIGAAGFVAFDYFSAWKAARQHDQRDSKSASVSLYIGIMTDMFIDGVIVGIAASVDMASALSLAIGLGVGQAPLTFVATAAAKRQGSPVERRRRLLLMYMLAILAGAMLGYLVLQGQPESVKLTLLAAAGGVLLAAVTQVMIPEAIEALHDEPPSLTGLMYVAGLAAFLLLNRFID
jgi:ZIP family zinc transporter